MTTLNRLWQKRADYHVGKTRKQRQQQFRSQTNLLIGLLSLTVIAAGIFMYLNWRGAGSTKEISCGDFPQYCVPFAGGNTVQASNEASGARKLDESSKGVPGVVRGFTADNRPFIGNPDAPMHVRVVPSFACSHCRDYHEGDLTRFLNDAVLKGHATLEFNFIPGVGGTAANTADQAALCAGEQGGLWEMNDELYRLAGAFAPEQAFAQSRIAKSARAMNLDDDKLLTCINSGHYAVVLGDYQTFANDQGVEGTPTVFVRYGNSDQWTKVDNPSYATLMSLAQQADLTQ